MKRHISSTLFVLLLYCLLTWQGARFINAPHSNLSSLYDVWVFLSGRWEGTLCFYVVGLYVATNLRMSPRWQRWFYWIPLLSCLLAPFISVLLTPETGEAMVLTFWEKYLSKPSIWLAPAAALSLYIFYGRSKKRREGQLSSACSSSKQAESLPSNEFGICRNGGVMTRRLISSLFVFCIYSLSTYPFYKGLSSMSSEPYSSNLILGGWKVNIQVVFMYYVVPLYVAECWSRRLGGKKWVYILPFIVVIARHFFQAFIVSMIIPSVACDSGTFLYCVVHWPERVLVPAVALSLYFFYWKNRASQNEKNVQEL